MNNFIRGLTSRVCISLVTVTCHKFVNSIDLYGWITNFHSRPDKSYRFSVNQGCYQKVIMNTLWVSAPCYGNIKTKINITAVGFSKKPKAGVYKTMGINNMYRRTIVCILLGHLPNRMCYLTSLYCTCVSCLCYVYTLVKTSLYQILFWILRWYITTLYESFCIYSGAPARRRPDLLSLALVFSAFSTALLPYLREKRKYFILISCSC